MIYSVFHMDSHRRAPQNTEKSSIPSVACGDLCGYPSILKRKGKP
jgi:hypothetical protein